MYRASVEACNSMYDKDGSPWICPSPTVPRVEAVVYYSQSVTARPKLYP
jgi:uncharacterized protein YbbC (DUF1343 family)